MRGFLVCRTKVKECMLRYFVRTEDEWTQYEDYSSVLAFVGQSSMRYGEFLQMRSDELLLGIL